jgi:hypothetical protein
MSVDQLKNVIEGLRAEVKTLKQKINDQDQGYNLKLFNFGSRKSYFKCKKDQKKTISSKMKDALFQLNTNFLCQGIFKELI